MQLTSLSSFVLALALVPIGVLQAPVKPPTPEPKKPDPADHAKPKSSAAQEADRIREELLGAWRMVRFEMEGETFSGDACHGYLLVQPDYLSLDMQVQTQYVRDPITQGQLWSAVMQRWKYDESRLQLVTSSMIGVSNFNNATAVAYEPAGTGREYRIDLAGDSLTLERTSTTRLFFQRMSKPTQSEPPTKKK